MSRLFDLICDVNHIEIEYQNEIGNLANWAIVWRGAARAALDELEAPRGETRNIGGEGFECEKCGAEYPQSNEVDAREFCFCPDCGRRVDK